MGTVVGKKNPNSRTSISTHQQNASVNSNNADTVKNTTESHTNAEYLLSPTYYINSLIQRESKLEVRSKLVSDLSVRLRTMPVR